MKIYSFISKKKFGKITLINLIKYAVITLMAVYIPIVMIAFGSNLFTKTDKYAAVLLSAHALSDYDYWAPPIACVGSYPAWTLYFNSRNMKIDYIFNVTKEDFMRVLQDDKYQSIVLVGHGSRNSWRATDDTISNHDIEVMQDKFKKKTGEWIQLSCAEKDYSDVHLGELVMAKGNVYYYQKDTAGTVDFILDALTAFRHIKKGEPHAKPQSAQRI